MFAFRGEPRCEREESVRERGENRERGREREGQTHRI